MTPHWDGTPNRTVLPLSAMSVYFDGQYSEPRLWHPEGVAIGPDRAVWCGNAEGDILRIDPETRTIGKVASTGGFSLGLAFDGRGALYVCDQKSAAVWKLDIGSGRLERFTPPGIRIPNYPVVDGRRNCLYVSDSYAGGADGPGVWRYDLATGAGALWWDRPMAFANGMALSQDGHSLYVVETFARRVSRIAIDDAGETAGIEPFVENISGLPDGIALDDAGRLYISCYEPSRILRASADGKTLDIYAEDVTAHLVCHPTNIAFSGSTLYAANLGRWHITHIETDTTASPVVAQVQRQYGIS